MKHRKKILIFLFILTAISVILLAYVSALNIGANSAIPKGLQIIQPNTCPAGNYSYGDDGNGNILCRSDQIGSGGGGGGSNVTSVASGDSYLVISPTTGNVIATVNSANLNTTISQFGVAAGFNVSSASLPWSDQAVNKSSNVTFANITAGELYIDTIDGGTIDGFFPVTCSLATARMLTSISANGVPSCVSTIQLYNHTLQGIKFYLDLNGTNANTNISINSVNLTTNGKIFSRWLEVNQNETVNQNLSVGDWLTTKQSDVKNNETVANNLSIGDSLFIGSQKINQTRAMLIYNYSLVPLAPGQEIDPVYTADIPRIVYNDIANTINGGTQVIEDTSADFPLSIAHSSHASSINFEDVGDSQMSLVFSGSGGKGGRIYGADGNKSLSLIGVTDLRFYTGNGQFPQAQLTDSKDLWFVDTSFQNLDVSKNFTVSDSVKISGLVMNITGGNLYFGVKNGGNISSIDYLSSNNSRAENLTILKNKIYNKTGSFFDFNFPLNGTGLYTPGNVVVPHQRFDITSGTAFDQNYNNTLDRPIMIEVNVDVGAVAGQSYANLTTGFSQPLRDYAIIGTSPALSVQATDLSMTGSMIVQPGEQWAINKTTGVGSSLALRQVHKTIL